MDPSIDSPFHRFLAARSEVEKMKPYSAPLEGRRTFLRLDLNENTLGPSPQLVEALRNISPHEIAIYPEYTGLREAFVDHLSFKGLSCPLISKQIGLSNGVDAAIHAIFHAYGDRGETMLTTTPTFGYYTPCAQMQGMEILSIPYKDQDFLFPFDEICEAIKGRRPRLFFLCNPNNPTGTRLSPEKIIEIANISPETLVVVDELYEAFTGYTVLPTVNFPETPTLLVLRSLSKTAGLAGLRIGFLIGSPDVVDRINRVTGPYDINSFAVTAAFAALADQPYTDAYIKEVLHARSWIKTRLLDSGTRHHMDGGNYFLIWPRRQHDEVDACLRKGGILVRDMAGKALIDGSLRVGIGTTSQMQEFWNTYLIIENQ